MISLFQVEVDFRSRITLLHIVELYAKDLSSDQSMIKGIQFHSDKICLQK